MRDCAAQRLRSRRDRVVRPSQAAQFFTTLYTALVRGGRAVLQFYPESPAQVEMITTCAMRAGFSGGLVIDYPNSSKRKKSSTAPTRFAAATRQRY